MKLSLLDMGRTKFGDSIYLENQGVKVLIHGGHAGDFDGQLPETKSIPAQLAQLSQTPANKPLEVDLLVVTHPHSDHIGCLPRMVASGNLKAKFALLSDPDHRWSSSPSSKPTALQKAVDLLAEEVPPLHQFQSKAELRAFLAAAANEEGVYRGMIEALRKAGTVLVRYGTDPISKPLKTVLSKAGLTIIGPTKEHLQICARALAGLLAQAQAGMLQTNTRAARASNDYVALYLQMKAGSGVAAAARAGTAPEPAGAVNNLSIVLSLKVGAVKILLPGDMQFGDPEIKALKEIMATLVQKAAAAGPYQAIKTPHHTSRNGWTLALHTSTLSTPLLLHSGGSDDPDHPEAGTLEMLKANASGHTFLRTDRNGLIEIEPSGKKLTFKIAKGRANDFGQNSRPAGALPNWLLAAGITPSTVVAS